MTQDELIQRLHDELRQCAASFHEIHRVAQKGFTDEVLLASGVRGATAERALRLIENGEWQSSIQATRGSYVPPPNANPPPAKKQKPSDTEILDWLLNHLNPVKEHTGGWPYPDTRGTYGPRFVGQIYYESCEGRAQDVFFKNREQIIKAMQRAAPR